MQLEHANLRGDVHGGWIMKLVDEAGAIAAMRHAQRRVATVAIDQMRFREPIRIGTLIRMKAEVTYVGHTSMEVMVNVAAEDPFTGTSTHTNTAYLVYVALDENDRPTRVPHLITETETEKKLFETGKARQAYRLAQREKEEEDF
jgi:acyl-CoA hydrolase